MSYKFGPPAGILDVRTSGLLCAMLCAAALVGCGASRNYAPAKPPTALLASTVVADSEFERAVLDRLPQLEGQQVVSSGAGVALVHPGYHAANGRVCRSVELRTVSGNEATTRLACSAGQGWFFVPDLTTHAGPKPAAGGPSDATASAFPGAQP